MQNKTDEPFYAILTLKEIYKGSYSTVFKLEDKISKQIFTMRFREFEELLLKGNFQEERGMIVDGKWVLKKWRGQTVIEGIYDA